MNHDLKRRKFDLENQLPRPWDFAHAHYRHLDGWEKQNRIKRDNICWKWGKSQYHAAPLGTLRQRVHGDSL